MLFYDVRCVPFRDIVIHLPLEKGGGYRAFLLCGVENKV